MAEDDVVIAARNIDGRYQSHSVSFSLDTIDTYCAIVVVPSIWFMNDIQKREQSCSFSNQRGKGMVKDIQIVPTQVPEQSARKPRRHTDGEHDVIFNHSAFLHPVSLANRERVWCTFGQGDARCMLCTVEGSLFGLGNERDYGIEAYKLDHLVFDRRNHTAVSG